MKHENLERNIEWSIFSTNIKLYKELNSSVTVQLLKTQANTYIQTLSHTVTTSLFSLPGPVFSLMLLWYPFLELPQEELIVCNGESHSGENLKVVTDIDTEENLWGLVNDWISNINTEDRGDFRSVLRPVYTASQKQILHISPQFLSSVNTLAF
jgi:hypothetical protein